MNRIDRMRMQASRQNRQRTGRRNLVNEPRYRDEFGLKLTKDQYVEYVDKYNKWNSKLLGYEEDISSTQGKIDAQRTALKKAKGELDSHKGDKLKKKILERYEDIKKNDFTTLNVTLEGGNKIIKSLMVPQDLLQKLPKQKLLKLVDPDKKIYEYGLQPAKAAVDPENPSREPGWVPVGHFSQKMKMFDEIEKDLESGFVKAMTPEYLEVLRKGHEDIYKAESDLFEAETDVQVAGEKVKLAREDYETQLAERKSTYEKGLKKRRALVKGL